jgi:hypothetical protein
MDDDHGGGEDGGGEYGAGQASNGNDGQQQGDAEDDDGRSNGQQDDNEHGSQTSQPDAEDAEMDEAADEEDGDSDSNSQPTEPPAIPRPPFVLTPAGGLPDHQYAGRITRQMTEAQRARSAPPAPGQGYPSVLIAESQAAQMLVGLYGGEPDSEEDEDED